MISSSYSTMNDALLRKIEGKVELYNGSTLLDTFLPTDKLQEVTVARVGEKGKFFGFGICQQATVKIVDKAGELTFLKGENLKTSFRANAEEDDEYTRVCPSFYIKDAVRDENTNVITITAYDAIDGATTRTFSELGMEAPYTIRDVVERVTSLLGIKGLVLSGLGVSSVFDLSYPVGANFSGDETLRAVLNAVAEVTQTIYYIDYRDYLVFKKLDKSGQSVLDIGKNDYFELNTALPVTITKIMSVTELGDNLEVGDDTGVIQYVRDNPFWNTRTDLQILLPEAIAKISGLTIVPYTLKWRGNFLTELCDKVRIEAKDGSYITTFILDDSFTYTGGLSQTSDWEYRPESDRATATNPITVGEKINMTFARVDKVNREITLHASEIESNKNSISELKVNTAGINATVDAVEQKVVELDDQTNSRIDTLTSEVGLKLDKQGVEITVEKKLEEGVDRVVTAAKKYSFDDTGLNVSSPDSEISTRILEDGMRIYKNSQEVLTADNTGVKAADLHAVTFLIIGENSRLEDRGNRTACFWIGPAGG